MPESAMPMTTPAAERVVRWIALRQLGYGLEATRPTGAQPSPASVIGWSRST